MELWIRSQDKTKLCQARYFELDNDKTGIFCFNGESYSVFAGKYKTKERALEVLDEIQNKIKQQFIVKSNILTSRKDIEREEKILKWKYDKEFIMQDNGFEITPINNNVFVYQLPVE